MKSLEQRVAEAEAYALAGRMNALSTPAPEGQKYAIGQRVWIGTLPSTMSHFPQEAWATVLYTYEHAYGKPMPEREHTYCLNVDGYGESSWYPEKYLTGGSDD